MRNYLFLGFISIAFLGTGQECEHVLFKGSVIDSLRPQSFYNLMIVNRTTGRGVFGQPNGTFSVYASDGDTIAMSVRGYPIIEVAIQADSNCQSGGTYYLVNKTLDFDPVVVTPLKSLKQIKEERAALAMRETRMVTGIEVLRSPITALYQAFSKTEKAKRWVAEQEFKDDQEEILKQLLQNYVAYDIIRLTDEEFDEFIAFLNVDITFLRTASEMELITLVKDKFEHFLMLKDQTK
jgi:hypothetical protein